MELPPLTAAPVESCLSNAENVKRNSHWRTTRQLNRYESRPL
jgi:hypothetical protein